MNRIALIYNYLLQDDHNFLPPGTMKLMIRALSVVKRLSYY